MSRTDCICNRNIKIIAEYVDSKLGHHDLLFDGLSYPSDRYASRDGFFLNEDEWTTYKNYQEIFRKAKEMVGEAFFYYYCGASSAGLRSWGRLQYFVRIFNKPCDGYKKIPFFNKHLNDTKDIDIIQPPIYDRSIGKIRTILRVQYHSDIDVHGDYIADPYRRGLIASIPTIWGLKPAKVRQPLSPYDPEILFNREPEFAAFGLNAEIKDGRLYINHPVNSERITAGKRVFLEPEPVNGNNVFLGKYREKQIGWDSGNSETALPEAILITETVRVENRILMRAGEILMAPYFILDATYDRVSFFGRLSQVFRVKNFSTEESEIGLVESNDRLREEVEDRNRAYLELGKVNAELIEAKNELENYNRNLEQMVREQTRELRTAKEELLSFNRNLEARVHDQVEELKRYNELRRYLSPNFAERILSGGERLGTEPQRKMLTVVFTDIRNFSAFTDSLEPEELFHLLDCYISEMTRLIHQYDGTLNKMIGDGLLVFFGDPIPLEDHAQRAVRMAVDMQRKVAELKPQWAQFGHELGIGIGINTGYMTVGNIGSDMHKDYTVIGNQVNVAARLESRAASGQILISQRTYSRVKDIAAVESVGKISVKGIHGPVITYNVLTG
jgi:adenylate cyclase